MTEDIERKARELSKQPYHKGVSLEEIEPGKQVFFLTYLELPGCMAQGDTLEEALVELEEVTFEYLLGYLEYGVSIPRPYATSQTTGGARRMMPIKVLKDRTRKPILTSGFAQVTVS